MARVLAVVLLAVTDSQGGSVRVQVVHPDEIYPGEGDRRGGSIPFHPE